MREPVYLVLRVIVSGEDYELMGACKSLADARNAADRNARMNPGTTYVIAPIGQAVTAEIATRWDE